MFKGHPPKSTAGFSSYPCCAGGSPESLQKRAPRSHRVNRWTGRVQPRALRNGPPQIVYDPAAPPRKPASHWPGEKPQVEPKNARPLVQAVLRPLACRRYRGKNVLYHPLHTVQRSTKQTGTVRGKKKRNKKSIDSRSHIT